MKLKLIQTFFVFGILIVISSCKKDESVNFSVNMNYNLNTTWYEKIYYKAVQDDTTITDIDYEDDTLIYLEYKVTKDTIINGINTRAVESKTIGGDYHHVDYYILDSNAIYLYAFRDSGFILKTSNNFHHRLLNNYSNKSLGAEIVILDRLEKLVPKPLNIGDRWSVYDTDSIDRFHAKSHAIANTSAGRFQCMLVSEKLEPMSFFDPIEYDINYHMSNEGVIKSDLYMKLYLYENNEAKGHLYLYINIERVKKP